MNSLPERPNILWLVSEDNSPQFVGPYGDPLANTPTLDHLAEDGVVFDRAFATAPVCAPSRFSIITGCYASSFAPADQMRSKGDAPGSYEGAIPGWLRGFPAYLREAGYYCTNNAKEDYNAPIDVADAWDESSATAHWRDCPDGAPFFAVFNYMATHESSIHEGAPGRLPDGVSPGAVQLPAYLPDLAEIRADMAWYYDQNRRLDDLLAVRLRELADDGLAEDTIVVYYGDHGGVLPRSKRFCYDSGLRVPLIVHVPERWQHLWPAVPGGRVGELVTLMDLGPTALSLAGVEPPAHMHGRAVAGPSRVDAPDCVFGLRGRMDERYDVVRTVRDARYRYVRNYMPHRPHGQHLEYLYQAAGMRAFDAAYRAGQVEGAPASFFTERPFEELYDTDVDPDEVTNLADSPELQPVLERMRANLDRHIVNTCDKVFIPEGALSNDSDLHDPKVYPLERLMPIAATAAHRDPGNLPTFIDWLSDDHAVVRYWGTLGCLMLRGQAEPARVALEKRLDDESVHVQIVAAEALCTMGDAEVGLSLLEHVTTDHDQPRVRLQAINALDRVRDHACPTSSTIERAQQDALGVVRRVAKHIAATP